MSAAKSGALTIAPLGAERTPLLMTIARWRHEAFLSRNYSLEDSARQLEAVAADPGEAALAASLDGAPVGVCMLVRDELSPRHDVSPWLASLFVTPGRALVRAVEDHARALGRERLWLYTGSAVAFYEGCGWSVAERFDWSGEPFALMARTL